MRSGQPPSDTTVTHGRVAARAGRGSEGGGQASGWRYVGRWFSEAELELIQALCVNPAYPTRTAISRALCDVLGWYKPDGQRKDMSARVALQRMDADGLIALPGPTRPAPVPRRHLEETIEAGPERRCRLGELGELEVRVVSAGEPRSGTWNEAIARFHYLGYAPMSGAQLRYLVTAGDELVSAISFGASAWRLSDRDAWIGWGDEARREGLHLIVSNPRFLVMPWLRAPHLASHLLGRICRRLRDDWQARYGYQPVLVETFVEVGRHQGTCYKAANWIHVGRTKGRGKLDRYNAHALPVKDIYLYPLVRDFRHQLLGGAEGQR